VTSLAADQLVVGGWSPDGRTLVFDAAIGGNSDVYTVALDGGRPRQLTSEPSVDGIASWSGDGRWIYFASTRAGVIPDIWRVSPDGGPALRITRNGGFDAKESPDGRYVFFCDRPPGAEGAARLMRIPVAGGPEQLVLERVWPFLWSVTDAGIVFVTGEPDFDAIDTYRFSDQRVTRAGRLGFRVPGILQHLSASRDGRWVSVTNLVRFDADLMMVDNFR
jgi:dipeptidyl aminopeptidase/acylaminoacyl peptidase